MHAEIPGWSNFAEEVFGGRQPTGRQCRLLEVQRPDSAWHHPVVEGVETLIAEGEVYSGPRFSPDTTVLLTAGHRTQDGRGRDVRPVAGRRDTKADASSVPRLAWTMTSASRVSFV